MHEIADPASSRGDRVCGVDWHCGEIMQRNVQLFVLLGEGGEGINELGGRGGEQRPEVVVLASMVMVEGGDDKVA